MDKFFAMKYIIYMIRLFKRGLKFNSKGEEVTEKLILYNAACKLFYSVNIKI